MSFYAHIREKEMKVVLSREIVKSVTINKPYAAEERLIKIDSLIIFFYINIEILFIVYIRFCKYFHFFQSSTPSGHRQSFPFRNKQIAF